MSVTGLKQYEATKAWRDKLFCPLSRILVKFGVTPNQISIFGLLVLIGFIYYIDTNLKLSMMFLIIHLLLDGLDGAVARLIKNDCTAGEIMDTFVDYTGMFIIIWTLGLYSYLDPNLGLLYVFLYLMMVGLMIVRYLLKIKPKFVVRSKYILYALFAWLVFTGQNYLNDALFIFSILMTPAVIISLAKVNSRLKTENFKIKDY